MKAYIDRLAGVFDEIVLFCNSFEIDAGDLPNYLHQKGLGWWADTFRAVYTVLKKRRADEIAQGKQPPDYWRQTMQKIETYPALRGYVLDDVHSISPAEFEEVCAAIRQYSKKTIVASFGATSDVLPYMATISRYHVKIARQLYRQDAANSREPTQIVSRWLDQYICDVANLEYFQAGVTITSGMHLRDMFFRCIAAGVTGFQGYAAVDADGFKVWEHADLWAALVNCAKTHKERYG